MTEDYEKMARIEGIQSMLAPIILQCMTMYGEEETFEAMWRATQLLTKNIKRRPDASCSEKTVREPERETM